MSLPFRSKKDPHIKHAAGEESLDSLFASGNHKGFCEFVERQWLGGAYFTTQARGSIYEWMWKNPLDEQNHTFHIDIILTTGPLEVAQIGVKEHLWELFHRQLKNVAFQRRGALVRQHCFKAPAPLEHDCAEPIYREWIPFATAKILQDILGCPSGLKACNQILRKDPDLRMETSSANLPYIKDNPEYTKYIQHEQLITHNQKVWFMQPIRSRVHVILAGKGFHEVVLHSPPVEEIIERVEKKVEKEEAKFRAGLNNLLMKPKNDLEEDISDVDTIVNG